MKSIIATASLMVCLALLTGCATQVRPQVRRIDVGTLISEVAAGHHFEGTELVVSGLALGSRDPSGTVNLGSDDYLSFISVYGVELPPVIHEGMPLAFNVRVQRTISVPSDSGRPVVMINTTYRSCVSCGR